jgi:hypothetical protein
LDQFNKGLQDSLFISIILFRLRSESIPRRFLCQFCAMSSSGGTSIGNLDAALSSICTKLAHVCTAKNGSAAESFAGVFGQGLSLFSSRARPAAGFVERYSAPAKTLSLR